MIGKYKKILENRGNLDFWIFRRVLRPGRHPRGFPELVGCILYEYEPERSHMDLFQIYFHDFLPKSGILQCKQPLYLLYMLYKDHTVSVCPYHSSENPYHPSTATGLSDVKLESVTLDCPDRNLLQHSDHGSCWERWECDTGNTVDLHRFSRWSWPQGPWV